MRDFVIESADPFKVLIEYGNNWVQMNSFPIAIQGPLSAAALRISIENLINSGQLRGREKSSLSIMLVGKSAGAILIWNGLRVGYDYFRDFHRVAVVLVDPHGAAVGDGELGSYNCGQPLTWPSNWSKDTDFFRVYNIYQQLYPGAGGGLTGANFPDNRVYSNIKLHGDPTGLFNLNHTTIPMHRISRMMIRCALRFVNSPRAGTVSMPPINIVIQNGRGPDRSTVDGKEGIEFFIENLEAYVCEKFDGTVQASHNGVVLKTWNFFDMLDNQLVRYHPKRTNRVDLNVFYGTQTLHKAVNLDYKPPTFEDIVITPNIRQKGSVILYANQVRDDGYWDKSDYQTEVTLDGRRVYKDVGTGITLKKLAEGHHKVRMRIRDGFGHWSDSKTKSFTVTSDPPNLAFIKPSDESQIDYMSELDIIIEASSASGIMFVEIFLDRISRDEFDNTTIGIINGIFGEGQSERKSLPPVKIKSKDSLNWSTGWHKLIAVAKDNSYNETTIERKIFVKLPSM